MPDLQNFGDWPLYALSDIAHYHNGFAFKPKDWSEDGVRIIRIEQLNNPDGPYDRFTGTYPSINHIDDGDLIFSWSATLKVLIWKHGSCVLNQHLFRVDEKEGFDKQYIYYILDYHMDSLAGSSHGSTMKHIKRGELQKYRVPIPSPNKQKKIAIILQTIDRAIAHTEALIEKYHQIKAGLMHDLFTRGIGADGKLRPTREEAPELYQESAIGWIPKEWEIKCLADACEWYSGGTPNRQNSFWWDGDLPWLSPKDMKSFDLSNTQEKVTRVAALSSSRIMPVNTVFIVIRGMILAHSFPVVYSNREFCFNQDIKAIRGLGKLGNRFLAYWFVAHKDTFLKKTTESTHGTKRFDMKDIYNLHIGIPSDKEQGLFITKLDALSTKLEFENKSLVKLQKQKSGLMHDLLTGKVPVKVNPDEVDHISN